jgi:hypothetical protein
MLGDAWRFIIGVFGHWQGYVTGGSITALVLLYEKISGHDLPRRLYLGLFVAVFFPLSCFFAWREQYRIALLVDDKARQHEKADEYAPLLQSGRKIMVKWVDASRPGSKESNAEQRAAAFTWLDTVRNNLDQDFGPAVAMRFNLGKPRDTNLGISEPREHEARVLELETLMREMRAGQLPVRLRK